MICASCGAADALEDSPCADCGEDPALDGRYALLDIIGRGGAGVTYRARRLSDRELVCVKELAYNRLADFDAEKLFEREASVLRQLAHPGIPGYVDHFTAGEGKALSLYLVQEFVRGHTLDQEMGSYRYTELEVLGIMDELAKILSYLEELRPRVVHRDIKPANIIRRDADNRLLLVDFGSVKATTQADGQTIVGTAGYMAPEQAWGTATSQSDFYALGVLGVVLLSRREPHELLDEKHALHWEPHVECSPATRELLSELLRADLEERPESAEHIRHRIARARQQLENPVATSSASSSRAPRRAVSQQPQRRAPGEIVDGHNHSKANAKRMVLVVAAVSALLVVGVGVFVGLMTVQPVESTGESVEVSTPVPEPKTEPPEQQAELPRCPSGDCVAFDAPFKDRLEFGMSSDDAIVALENTGRVQQVEPRLVTHRRVGGEQEHGISLPGTRLRLETTTAGETSTCELEFAVDGGLSALSCQLEPMDSLSGHRSAMKRIVNALIDRYGQVTDNNSGTVVEGSVFNEKNSWTWEDEHGRIDVESRFRRVAGEVEQSVLSIVQSTPAHRALVDDAQRRSFESFEQRQDDLESEPL